MNEQAVDSGRFAKYAWFVLLYMIFVILWGAFVRASGSGAGCGEHWPLCNGTVIPRQPTLETIIELSHRLTSGLALIFVVILTVWAFRRFPKTHAARHGATLSLIFLLIEAGLGAGLVLLSLVAYDDSIMRAVAVALHLVNTFVLLGCLTYTAWFATMGVSERFAFKAERSRTFLVLTGLGLFVLVGASGAIVALGDTLFPSRTLVEGFRQDISPTAHFLIRLRLLHPVLAILASTVVIFLSSFLRARDPRPIIRKLSQTTTVLIVIQVFLGLVNMGLLAPVWLQIVHLLVADVTWIALFALALETVNVPAWKTVLTPTLAMDRELDQPVCPANSL